ncbi:MAG: hypothetical protein ACR2QM_04240 [Longimicrobiales bacterium]
MVGPRRGFVLLELLVAGVLILMLVQAGWWVVAVQGGVSGRVVEAARALDGARIARHLVTVELQQSGSEEDFEVLGSEIRLRAFRGIGVFCGGEGDEWWVNTVGHRHLDEGKDSVLVFDPHEGWRSRTVDRRAPSAAGRCTVVDGFREERWVFAEPMVAPVVGRYFERGGYRFSEGAFRSLQGRGGWQPITEGKLNSDESGLEGIGRQGVRGRLVWADPRGLVDPVSWLSWVVW